MGRSKLRKNDKNWVLQHGKFTYSWQAIWEMRCPSIGDGLAAVSSRALNGLPYGFWGAGFDLLFFTLLLLNFAAKVDLRISWLIDYFQES